MAEKTADLHIHSYYSDGTMSPKEILEEALQNNVGLIALTDHDMLDGSRELGELCRDADVTYLPGVELNTLEEGLNFHVLGYGMDINNEEFMDFVDQNRSMLFTVNSLLIEKMEKDYPSLNVEEYNSFTYDRRKGGWKALHYLLDKGITDTLREGFALYPKYDCYYDVVNFPTIQAVCETIHKAGGKAILAHPGVSIKETDLALFEAKLLKFLDYGLDGVECYYVTHSEEITNLCLKVCEDRKLLITCGSDCHGIFGNAHVGDVNIPISRLKLGNLLE
ncbi:MAG TPA: PHP domain-containing protein [Mobilitalea sp.]|nr:PHP domain-containing protein [Mobilitalea sp.]